MTIAQEVKIEDCGEAKSYPPTPALSPKGGEGEREQIGGFSETEFDWIVHFVVTRESNAVGPLSLRERLG